MKFFSAASARRIASCQYSCWTRNSPSSSIRAPLISGFRLIAWAAALGNLTGAELLQVVRRRHTAGVEKVLVLPDAPRPRLGALALRGNAIGRHFRLIYGNGAVLADLRADLIH